MVALGLAVWLLVLPQLRGSTHSLHLLFRVNSPWLVVALVAEIGSLGLYALVTRSMLDPSTRPPLQRVMRIDLSAIALGHCVPDGGAAGTALCWRLLVGSGVPSADAAFAKLAQGLGSAVILQMLLLASYVAGATTGGLTRWVVAPAAVAIVLLAVFGLFVSCLRRHSFRLAVHRGLSRIPRYGPRVAQWTVGVYRRHMVEQLRAAVGEPRKLALASSWAAGNWALDGLALWASLHAYGNSVGLEGIAVAYGVQALATWLPITPSGLGISEGLMIPALITFGATRSVAVLGILTWRLLAYWLPIPLGAIAYGSLQRRPWLRTAQTG
jgi:hypothetical protein